jgi:predicted dehydrogenase
MSDKLKVVILGAGAISSFHADALTAMSKDFHVSAICDLDKEAAEKIADRFTATVYSDCAETIKSEKPDIALIALPHGLHLEYGLAALKAGCHLLLEKPMAISTKECQHLIDVAKVENRRILIGHTHRFRPHFRKAAELIKDGVIGDIKMIFDEAFAYYDFENRPEWFLNKRTAGGGALFNLTPHQVDHLLFLVNAPVKTVRGCVRSLREGVDIDTDCTAFIEFENGVHATLGSFTSTGIVEPPRLECQILGTKASLSLQAFTPEIIISNGAKRKIIDCSRDTEPFVMEWTALRNAIANDVECDSNGVYGRNVVAVLEAIKDSSDRGVAVTPDLIYHGNMEN